MNDYTAIKEMIDNSVAQNSTLTITLIIVVSVNIGVEIVRFVGMIILSNKDKSNKKQLLIEEKRIKIIEQLFQSLDSLTLYDKSEQTELLEKIKEINLFMTKNKLYITQKYQSHTTEILDYFKNVMTDYRLRSIENETKLFEKFCNEFNK